MRNIQPVHHHPAEQGEFRQRRAQSPQILPKPGAIERGRFEHAPAGGRTRPVRIIIGIGHDRLQRNLRVAFEVFDGFRTARKKSIAQVGVGRFGDGVFEIGGGIGGTIREACLLHLRVGGNPDHPARPRGGAADELRLLDDENPQSSRGGDRGRCHSTGACADDHDIIGLGGRHHTLESKRDS
jgi:hypothetical protein